MAAFKRCGRYCTCDFYLCFSVLALGGFYNGYSSAFDLIYYVFAGLAWIFPASVIVGWLARYEAK